MFPISLKSLSDKERHDYILKTFIINKKHSAEQRKHKRDIDVIREHHRFLWDDEGDAGDEDSWEVRLAKRYYNKLFKEYSIADLSRHKQNRVALRWRTEAEVVAGIGQFQCGSRKCLEKENLRSWEVNFAYQEQGERRNALVKLRLCPEHSKQLNYTSKKREVKRLKYMEREKVKREKRRFSKSKNKIQKDGSINESNGEEETLYAEDKDTEQDIGKELSTSSTDYSGNEDAMEMYEDIWKKKTDIEIEPVSREKEFERYLEDLLL